MNHTRLPGAVLLQRFALEAELCSVPSRTGEQCAALAEARQPEGPGRMAKLAEYGDLLLLTRDLNPDEMHLCRLRYGLQPEATHLATEQCRAAGIQPPTVEVHTRNATSWELDDLEKWTAETLVPGREGMVPGNPDLRKVRGYRHRLPSYEDLAQETGKSIREVIRTLSGALQKVAVAIQWSTLKTEIESRYDH